MSSKPTFKQCGETKRQLWVKIKNKQGASFNLGVLYGYSSESRVDNELIDNWFYDLEKTYSTYEEDPTILVGDLNAHIGNDADGIIGNHKNINTNGEKLHKINIFLVFLIMWNLAFDK